MRGIRVVEAAWRTLVAAAIVSAGVAGAAGAGAGCRKGLADALDPNEETTLTFLDSDFVTADLAGVRELAFTEADLVATMNAAEPSLLLSYDFTANECRWIGANVNSPEGTATVAATPDVNARDFLIICRSPTGRLLGNDDGMPAVCRDTTAACITSAACDPALTLDEAGVWTCLFTVSPIGTGCYAPSANDPVGGDITIRVSAPPA